jgi:uncharacterized protein
VIIADTGAVIALVDRADRHHAAFRALFADTGDEWRLPWAILPEVDYLLATHVGWRAHDAFLADLAEGAYTVLWGTDEDLEEAERLIRRHRALRMGLVDAVVMASAVRTKASAIATLDLRHFAAVKLPGAPKLLPRDAR